ncbi:MCE family protein [Mycobacterium hubeiense]|uniref:MCE family protein n=1 Tax=Mycobacterium hubeiense TaxID=1867256 RepID=UPI000C7E89F9|nr:MlaD family protein [Mycobacterium sp. QGD 101]
MHMTRRIRIQLAVFAIVAVVAVAVIATSYANVPAMLFGAGRYTVTAELPASGGLYEGGNVTYRGVEVGEVEAVRLTGDGGVDAVLSLRSGTSIPSDLDAEVHSQSAVGEQYVTLLPRSGASAPLKDGDVIPRDRTSVPPDINSLLDATNRGLEAIPQDNLKTVIDEGYTAVGGLGPEISRIVKGSTALALDARRHLDSLTTLIDQSQPVLDSQSETSDSVRAWASHVATVTAQVQAENPSVAGILEHGDATADEARQLVERLQPSLPVLLANLVSIAPVALDYHASLEQLLVLLPQGIAAVQGITVANKDTKQDYKGLYLDFNLNVNLNHPCTTGFLPAQQIRPPTFEDTPDRPAGLYCRIPQDSPIAIRGARNLPCMTVPGKRAPTVKMCESDEEYVPLNDGNNWKGDPNATLSGQDIPQLPPDQPPPDQVVPPAAVPPIATATYDPATGSYIGPDGRIHTRSDLAQGAKVQTWQDMLMPPEGN